MQTIRLAGDGPDVSIIGFGCWAAGGLWWGDDVRDEDSIAAIRKAHDLGISLYDTAPLYGHGHADTILARALGAHLQHVTIATKCGVRWDGDGAHARSDLSAVWLRQDIEQSLKRLGVERLDLVQVHWPCEAGTPLSESIATLQALVDEGKVGRFGLCNYSAEALEAALALGAVATLQTPYSMLRREYEHALRDVVTAHPQLTTLVYEPLCRGLLTGKHRATHVFPESDLRARDDRFRGDRYLRALALTSRLGLHAKRLGVSTGAIAIAWALRQRRVDIALVGAKRPEQVAQNIEALKLLGDVPRWDEIDRIAASWRG